MYENPFTIQKPTIEKALCDPKTANEFPHVLDAPDVTKYLKEKFKDDPSKTELCNYDSGCKVWPVEKILLGDLREAKTHKSEKVNYLRGLIRATSWLSHEQNEPKRMLDNARQLVTEFKIQRAEVARTDPDGAKEWNQLIEQADQVFETISSKLTGKDAEAGMNAIEILFDRELRTLQSLLSFNKLTPEKAQKSRDRRTRQAVNRVANLLRPLRDQISFQLLYPNWFTAGQSIKIPKTTIRNAARSHKPSTVS